MSYNSGPKMTLIELLVIVAIVATLASLIIPAVRKAMGHDSQSQEVIRGEVPQN